jgi:hypothetical protein
MVTSPGWLAGTWPQGVFYALWPGTEKFLALLHRHVKGFIARVDFSNTPEAAVTNTVQCASYRVTPADLAIIERSVLGRCLRRAHRDVQGHVAEQLRGIRRYLAQGIRLSRRRVGAGFCVRRGALVPVSRDRHLAAL